MTDPRELLRRYGAPDPLAVVMPTEIRSDGGLKLQMLAPPQWSKHIASAVILQWVCELDPKSLSEVSVILRRPDKDTGLQAEDAINRTLMKARLGSYIGTFIDEGPPPYTVRMLIGLQPSLPLSEDQLNTELAKVFHVPLAKPNTIESQAAAALRALRQHWWTGQRRSEARSMLLSLTNIDTLNEQSLYTPK